MSTRGLYQISDGTFVRTQGEIPKGEPISKVEIPVDSKGLCDWVNNLIAVERSGNVQPVPIIQVQEAPLEDLVPGPVIAVEPTPDHAAMRRKLVQEMRGMEVEAIEERILSMKAPALGRIMAACVERFGFLGADAWQSLRGFINLHARGANLYDRGLHMLAMHQIERLSEPKPEPKTYAELNK